MNDHPRSQTALLLASLFLLSAIGTSVESFAQPAHRSRPRPAQPSNPPGQSIDRGLTAAELFQIFRGTFLQGHPVQYGTDEIRLGQPWRCVNHNFNGTSGYIYSMHFTETNTPQTNKDHSADHFYSLVPERAPEEITTRRWNRIAFRHTISTTFVDQGSALSRVLLLGTGGISTLGQNNGHLFVVHRNGPDLIIEETETTHDLATQLLAELSQTGVALSGVSAEALIESMTVGSHYWGQTYRVISYQFCSPPDSIHPPTDSSGRRSQPLPTEESIPGVLNSI